MWADCFMLGQSLENQPKLLQIAEEWLNYALSDAYQADILRVAGYEPVTTTVINVLTPEEQARLHLSDPAAALSPWSRRAADVSRPSPRLPEKVTR